MSDAPRGSPVKGMILGVVVDIGGSLLATFLLFFVWALWLGASGLDGEGIAQSMSENDPLSGVSLFSYVLGGGFSWFGGYVCARVARETELACAAVVATVSTLVALAAGAGLPWGLYLFLTVLTFGTVMLGGWMGMKQNREPA